MYSVKIYGAGSIGNHLAHAARQLGWDVAVCDVDEGALRRMQHEIYPGRYGRWDDSIRLSSNDAAPRGEFDFIFVGTPPDRHMELALDAISEAPRILLIEKPLCKPSLEQADDLYQASRQSSVEVFVGYDHVVGKANRMLEGIVAGGGIGDVVTIDVDFREHWGGIFKAHPWLSGPQDSYLGYWERGGGASGEHSHAVNLWQHLAHVGGGGRVTEVSARLDYRSEGEANYDAQCLMSLKTENGLLGRVVQDVVTRPTVKRARVQGTEGVVDWIGGYNAEGDAVIQRRDGEADRLEVVEKSRPDDFLAELRYLEGQLSRPEEIPVTGIERGLDSMLVIAASHRSEREGRRISIDYDEGYKLSALKGYEPT